MASEAMARLRAMTNRWGRRLDGIELEKAVGLAAMMKVEAERELRDINRELAFLRSKPPTLRDGWKLPPRPTCSHCGDAMHPHAEFDCGDVWLGWSCECGETSEEPEIEWPWVELRVYPIDAAAAGFTI